MDSGVRIGRRTFLGAAAAGTMAAARVPAAGAAAATGARPALFKISLAQWSLHKALQGKKIDHLDFAKIANGFGIDAVEYVNSFFKERRRTPGTWPR